MGRFPKTRDGRPAPRGQGGVRLQGHRRGDMRVPIPRRIRCVNRLALERVRQAGALLRLVSTCVQNAIITTEPATMRPPPIAIGHVIVSPTKSTPRAMANTTLSLSTGATRLTGPSWRAR